MKLITEVSEDIKYFAEEKDGKRSLFIEGVFLQSNLKNRNGRVYPKEIMRKEVDRYRSEAIDKKRAMGELGHPDGPTLNLDRVSHMITSLKDVFRAQPTEPCKGLVMGNQLISVLFLTGTCLSSGSGFIFSS